MGRIVVAEVRLLDLTWVEGEGRFILRLLEGNRYVTPKLPLTPLDFLKLLRHQSVTLSTWARLDHDRTVLTVSIPNTSWAARDIRWIEFYNLATRERGCDPETGWKEEADQQKMAQRQTWDPA